MSPLRQSSESEPYIPVVTPSAVSGGSSIALNTFGASRSVSGGFVKSFGGDFDVQLGVSGTNTEEVSVTGKYAVQNFFYYVNLYGSTIGSTTIRARWQLKLNDQVITAGLIGGDNTTPADPGILSIAQGQIIVDKDWIISTGDVVKFVITILDTGTGDFEGSFGITGIEL
jgi:hypothetical protein